METLSPQDFGFYSPRHSRTASFLLCLTRLGLGRGKLKKIIAKQWEKLDYEVVDVESHGVHYRLHFRSNLTDKHILSGSKFHNKREILALARGNEGDAAFVDIGANTGYYSTQLARMGYAKVIAIEPAPVILDALSFNVAANSMQDKISIVPLCIGNGEEMTFYFSASGGWGVSSALATQKDTTPITVCSKPLLEIIQQEGIQRIGGMKVDVEGFEDRVLFDFFAKAPAHLHPKIAVVEVNKEKWERDIVEKMKSLGYRVDEMAQGRNLIFTL